MSGQTSSLRAGQDGQPGGQPAGPQGGQPGGQPKVLVVDDEEWMRDACTQILRPEGLEVMTAVDGQTGLEAARRHVPDLILVDLKMPGMDGIAYVESVKSFDPDVSAVVVTGYATIEVAVEAMKAGACDFLAKPFKPADLRWVVRRGLDHRHAAVRASALIHGKAPPAELHLAMLAHRFKEPLAVLRTCIGVVLQGYVGDISPRARGMIEVAAQRAEQMMRFVDDWLTLARLEQGKGLHGTRPVNLAEVVRAAVEQVRQHAEARKLTIRFEQSADPGPLVADAGALAEVFGNLLDNAARYTPAGGTITAEVDATEREAIVAVRDTGPGIEAADALRIFEPFYRAKAQKSIPGTGLGLPIARRLVEAHGGRLEVRSSPGQGAEFRVVLPRTGACTA